MTTHTEASLAAGLAELEATCRKVAQAIAGARSVREAIELSEVDIPHDLRSLAGTKVPTLRRLVRVRDNRVEELVESQLESLRFERNEFSASRELDRLKAMDWYVLRTEYPELYAKVVREASLVIERLRRR